MNHQKTGLKFCHSFEKILSNMLHTTKKFNNLVPHEDAVKIPIETFKRIFQQITKNKYVKNLRSLSFKSNEKMKISHEKCRKK